MAIVRGLRGFAISGLALLALASSTAALALPTVSLTSPTASQNFGAPAAITLRATATPTAGSAITKVEFYRSSTLIGTVNGPTTPHTFAWNSVAVGSYSLTAKAYDSTGNKTSTAVAITVTTNVVPTASITSPTAGATFAAGAAIPLAATATDGDGTTTKVEFFRGGSTLIGTATTSPYTFSWTGAASGSYSLTAKATDNSGGTKTSTAVAITVNANVLPTVSITSPTAGATFIAGANIALAANAVDSDGSISKVEFFRAGSTLIGTATTSPYTFT